MTWWQKLRELTRAGRRRVRRPKPSDTPGVTPGRQGLSRRAFLGGAGAAIALPLLESVSPKLAFAAPGDVPTRQLFFYVPNGIHMPAWTPAETGANYTLTPTLRPLEPHRSKVLVLSGLGNAPAQVPVAGDHARGTGSFLTCRTVKHTEGDDIQNGISADQVAANAIGEATRYPSMQLGLEGGASVGGCDSGYSCAYSRNISWADASTPIAKTTNPQVVFDRLFAGFDPNDTAAEREKRKRYRTSILDYAVEDTKALQNRVSQRDSEKLDEYLTGIRELEVRIQNADDGPACDVPGRPVDDYDVPGHTRIMIDLMTLAFQCDQTRVMTFMLGNAGSNRRFDGFLNYEGAPLSGQHHELSHHQGNAENQAKLQVINHWEVEQLAYLLEKFDSVTEEDGQTLLDHSLIVFSSEIEDGNSHRHFNLPVLLCGGGSGNIVSGRHLSYDNDEPIANLYISMLNATGVEATEFGADGTRPLPDLAA